MPLIQRKKTVSHPASKMYALINDIEAYPSFLEGCEEAQILRRDHNTIDGRLVLKKGPLTYGLTTRNTLFHDTKIEMNLLEGPFKSLKGIWQFKPLESGSLVSFDLEYEALFSLLNFTLRAFWEETTSTLIHSFCRRANEIYG